MTDLFWIKAYGCLCHKPVMTNLVVKNFCVLWEIRHLDITWTSLRGHLKVVTSPGIVLDVICTSKWINNVPRLILGIMTFWNNMLLPIFVMTTGFPSWQNLHICINLQAICDQESLNLKNLVKQKVVDRENRFPTKFSLHQYMNFTFRGITSDHHKM